MNRVNAALLPLALCTIGLSYAQAQSPVGSLSADPCGIIDLTSAQRVRVTAHQQVATRLQFPADIVYVVNAAPELWDDSRPKDPGRNLWVRPMTATEAGKTTSISVVTADQRNYEFLMEAAPDIPQTSCYDIVDSRAKSETDTELRARQSWEEAQAEFAALQDDREAASQQLSDRQRQLENEFGERAARAEDLAGALTGEFDQLRIDRERLSGAETALQQREETLAALEADRASRIREDDLSRRQIEFQESAAAADRARLEAEARGARQLQEARTREEQLLNVHRERSAQIDSITAARERALQDEISLSVQRNERLRAELAEERTRLEELRTRAEAATLLAKQSNEEAERNLERRYTAISEQARLQAGDAIEAFKYTVHTAYDWQYSQVPPQIVVDSVYDDGRRTYVRIANDAFGVPAVIGTNRRGSVALNYRYNDLTGVYEIQGLFHSPRIAVSGREDRDREEIVMLEPSEDPQDAREDNPRTRERPSDQGRKAMMVVIALLLLVAAGTAWNVVSRTNAKEFDPEPQPRVNVTPTSDASLQDTFASRLERRKQALRDAQLPTPVRQLISEQPGPLTQEAVKPLTPAEEWALQQELKALRALAKPMKVTGVWPDPPKEPRPAAPVRRDAEELEIEPASSETLDAKIDGYYKLLDQIEARQRAREVSK